MMPRFLILLLSLSLTSLPLVAADVRALFRAGSDALAAGKADEAVTDFEAAYAAQPAPSLLYWLGEANRAAGHPAKAARYYRRYLKTAPRGEKRADAKAHLAELKKDSATGKRRKSRRMRADEIELPQKPALPDLPLPDTAQLATPEASALKPEADQPSMPEVAAAEPPAAQPPAAEPPAEQPTAEQPAPQPPSQPVAEVTPPANAIAASDDFYFVSYTARLLAPSGSRMLNYATTATPGDGTLYTHGFAAGRQTEHFKNALYFGFGTEFGGGSDTLSRYELSFQLLYAPFGFDPFGQGSGASTSLVSPHLGFRIGGMGVSSQTLTGGSFKPGVVLAAQAGLDLQILRWLVLTPGVGYDLNLGPDLGPNASVSGYSFDLGATLRY